MNGDRNTYVKQILTAIDYGRLPTDETERRLIQLIEEEHHRTDRVADIVYISCCQSLLMELCQIDHRVSQNQLDILQRRINLSIRLHERESKRPFWYLRAIAIVASLVFVFLSIIGAIRWVWFDGKSTPDNQQFIIQGHEITIDLIKEAIALNQSSAFWQIDSPKQLLDHVSFAPVLPSLLDSYWIEADGTILYSPFSIHINYRYVHKQSNEECQVAINYFLDMENALLSIEQSGQGENLTISDTPVYLCQNIDSYSACWQENTTVYQLFGLKSMEETLHLCKLLIIGGLR